MAPYPQHDGNLTQFPDALLPVAIVDLVFEPCAQLASIGSMSLTAFRWIDVSVTGREFVRGRQHSLFQKHFLDANIETVPLWGLSALCQPDLSLLSGLREAV